MIGAGGGNFSPRSGERRTLRHVGCGEI